MNVSLASVSRTRNVKESVGNALSVNYPQCAAVLSAMRIDWLRRNSLNGA